MISSISFKLKRTQVEAVSKNFFHLWRLLMASKEKDLEGCELDDGTMHWITYLALMQELDKYFADRMRSPAKEIKITLSTAQAMALYRAVMNLPLADHEYFLLQVRQALVEHLFSFLIQLPITINPRKKQPVLQDWDWE